MPKEFYNRKKVRSPDRDSGEHLNSPVDDPGYWPYDQLAGGLQADLTGIKEPANPVEYVPDYHRSKSGVEDFEKE